MRMNANIANKIVYLELSYKIVGVSYKIQNELGRFCTEKQYANTFENELKKLKIIYKREKYLPIQINNKNMGKNWADFIIEEKVVIDLKAKPYIERSDYYQMQRYLNLANIKLGLIINFQNKYLKPKRVLNSQYSQNS
ncbi:MAG TPA: GxxExxY protein [Candidatus Wolfebacteria bacterium]|nr:GxxExxY protein [Candidatus Wolfebacteria bacterium]